MFDLAKGFGCWFNEFCSVERGFVCWICFFLQVLLLGFNTQSTSLSDLLFCFFLLTPVFFIVLFGWEKPSSHRALGFSQGEL